MKQRPHAIITGGSSGIGKAVAVLLAGRGMHITIMARTEETLTAAAEEIRSACISPEQQVEAPSVDVSDQEAVARAMERAIEKSGPPELLITSAGIARPGYFEEIPDAVFEQTMQINYFGTLYAIRAALPAMEAQGRGRVVLISSGAGIVGVFGYTPYSPTKFALRGLAECLRGELKLKGVGVSIVYPPDTDTPQLAAENRTKPEETKLITGSAAMWSAEDVAKVIVRGIDKKRFCIAPGWEMTLINIMHSVINPIIQWQFDRLAAKARNRDEGDGGTKAAD